MFEGKVTLPAWLEPMEGMPGHYIADPDGFYPYLLRHMGFDIFKPSDAEGAPTRYDLEAAYGTMKKLVRWYGEGHAHGPAVRVVIPATNGRKQRWKITNFPVGNKPDISAPHMAGHRGTATRNVWEKIMGPWVNLKRGRG